MTPKAAVTQVQDPSELRTSPRTSPWRRLVTFAIVAVIAFFLARSIVGQWGTISHYNWAIRWGWLLLSCVLVWIDFVIMICVWRYLLDRIGGSRLEFGRAYRVWFLSNMGKYVPGKVWTVMGMVYLLKAEGYTAPSVLVTAVLNQMLSVLSGLVFSIVILGGSVFGGLPLWLLVVGGLLSMAVLAPPVFQRLVSTGLRLIKSDPITIRLSYGVILAIFLVYLATWIVYGAAFWALLLGIGIESSSPFWVTAAVFSASYLLGFLALFAPGGLGVREGSLAVLIGPHVPAGLAAPVAVLSRVWLTLTELLGALPLLWLRRKPDTT